MQAANLQNMVTSNKIVISGENAEQLMSYFNDTGDLVNELDWWSWLILFLLTWVVKVINLL